MKHARLKCASVACGWVGPEAQECRVLAFCCPTCHLMSVLLAQDGRDFWSLVPDTASFTFTKTVVPA